MMHGDNLSNEVLIIITCHGLPLNSLMKQKVISDMEQRGQEKGKFMVEGFPFGNIFKRS